MKLTSKFFAAGNCTFTVKVPVEFVEKHGCNLHYTFKISKSEEGFKGSHEDASAYFINLLTGPDNTSNYSYLGKFIPTTGEVVLTVRSCAGSAAWSVRILRRVLAQMFEGEGMDAITRHGWNVDHMNKCGRCGRPLTVPESIEVGLGPDCAEIMGIPFQTRTTPQKPRKKKEAEIDPASSQEPPQAIVGDLPALPKVDIFF